MNTVAKRRLAAICGIVLLAAAVPAFGGDVLSLMEGLGASSDFAAVPRVYSKRDTNKNGINDTVDIIDGARLAVRERPVYRSAYYKGGDPPAGEGVCTDIIRLAYRHAGYDLQKLLDDDIRKNPGAYPRARPRDSNIDYRRVPNLLVFLRRHGKSLPTAVDKDPTVNAERFQPGDLVTFTNPDHIAVLSDKRNAQGLPYLLHNDGPVASEADDFMIWYNQGITGHFRFPAD